MVVTHLRMSAVAWTGAGDATWSIYQNPPRARHCSEHHFTWSHFILLVVLGGSPLESPHCSSANGSTETLRDFISFLIVSGRSKIPTQARSLCFN